MPSRSLSVSSAVCAIILAYQDMALVRAVPVDATWHAPAKSAINDLDSVLTGQGVYGFIFNTSKTPDERYGTYNWCNMPHVRKSEYVTADKEYELLYVELMHRHHKRTPYSSNAFPVESYHWNCDDSGLYYYGQSFEGYEAAKVYQSLYISPTNPFVQSGWIGTCKFPQITAGGLDDSWQHGADLYGVYGDLLHLLPLRGSSQMKEKVKYRVTNNVITSQVAGMAVNGMWSSTGSVPLAIQADGVDSLEPQYRCSAADRLFNSIKSSSNTAWQAHLDRSSDLYAILDDISGVPHDDSGFHASFDHYYDNLSARQCHAKPLPCKLVNGKNSTTCVTEELANKVYRLGNWEYSQIYRDSSSSLQASAASLGVWIGELTSHWRDVVSGKTNTVYFHNVAHDGSVSRLLSILQIDKMIWPGMGSEVVFELYRKKRGSEPTATPVASTCNRDNCLRYLIQHTAAPSSFCKRLDSSEESKWPSQCSNSKARVSSACACLNPASATSTSTQPTATTSPVQSQYFVRVLFGGQVMKSSNPSLGTMDMVPLETMLEYFDQLVGQNAASVKTNCK